MTHFHELDHCTMIDKADIRKEKKEGEGAADDVVSSKGEKWKGGTEPRLTVSTHHIAQKPERTDVS